MREWLAVGLVALGFQGIGRAAPVGLDKNYELRLPPLRVPFNPTHDSDLRRLAVVTASDKDTKHNRRGLTEIRRLANAALSSADPAERAALELDLLEVTLAVNNNERPTIPRRFDGFETPLAFLQFHRPIGVGESPATDLAPGPSDLSRRNPLPSTFWQRPANIGAEDLAAGFGRSSAPKFDETICAYSAAKETRGMNPGYEVDCDGVATKLKFGEVSSEPFVARIFSALGFNADPTDYAPSMKVKYDRRIFTEFNHRLPVATTFTFLWFIPVYKMNLQPHKDPFAYVARAVLKNGQQWSGPELKRHLLDGTNFLPAVEAQLDYIVTTPANVQAKEDRGKSIGPWDYGQLDHADRREVRGAGLLAAWVGFYDTRFDNTKLRLVGPKKRPRLAHYFSDLGGGLGRTTGLISWHGENPEAFPWTFTKPPLNQGQGRLARPLRIVGYTPVVRTPAFAAMTIDDARWMARLIAQLTEAQISQALAASGYEPATVRLYTAKLISRRDHMMQDLGLASEFPPLRPTAASP